MSCPVEPLQRTSCDTQMRRVLNSEQTRTQPKRLSELCNPGLGPEPPSSMGPRKGNLLGVAHAEQRSPSEPGREWDSTRLLVVPSNTGTTGLSCLEIGRNPQGSPAKRDQPAFPDSPGVATHVQHSGTAPTQETATHVQTPGKARITTFEETTLAASMVAHIRCPRM